MQPWSSERTAKPVARIAGRLMYCERIGYLSDIELKNERATSLRCGSMLFPGRFCRLNAEAVLVLLRDFVVRRGSCARTYPQPSTPRPDEPRRSWPSYRRRDARGCGSGTSRTPGDRPA